MLRLMKNKRLVMIMLYSFIILASTFSMNSCGGGGGGGGALLPVSSSNKAPVANAGPDQNVLTGSVVTLNGSGSSDADGDTLTYNWSFSSKPDGSTATFSNSAAVSPTFTADKDGSYEVRLVVNDGKVDSTGDTVTITATTGNLAPVANAGPDRGVNTGALVMLDGSGSSDANGDALTYSWSIVAKPAGSTVTLANSTVVNPSFVPDKNGSYIFSLVVNDGQVNSPSADTVTMKATAMPTMTGKIPDTGQTTSYSETFGEDHDYLINPPSYTDNGDGTIKDNVTGLIWQKQDDATSRTWSDANSYCNNNIAGLPGGDWRLPTRLELVNIANYGNSYPPTINTTYFPNTQSVFYWSSSTYAYNTSSTIVILFKQRLS